MSKKNQLIIAVLTLTAIGAITSLIAIYFIKDKIGESLIQEETNKNISQAQLTVDLLEKEIRTIQEKVSLLAQFPQIQSSDSKACNEKLAEAAPYLQPQIDNITRFNTKLTLDCAINKNSIGYVLMPNSPIAAIIKDPNHAPYLSYSGYSPISNQEVLYLNLPIYTPTGAYYGIIGGVIYLNYIAEKYLSNVVLGSGGFVSMIDDNGNFLYHPEINYIGKSYHSPNLKPLSDNPSTIQAIQTALEDSHSNKTGTIRYLAADKEMLAVYAPAQVFQNRIWTVILTVPIETILSKIDSNQGSGGLGLFIFLSSATILTFLIFSAIILFLVIRGLFDPLLSIKNVTQRIGQGDLDASVSPSLLYAQNEFGELARDIKDMTLKLKDSYSILEQKVKERTQALETRTQESEKVSKFMIDRELKMVELKNENTRLKEKLKDLEK